MPVEWDSIVLAVKRKNDRMFRAVNRGRRIRILDLVPH